jgi:hypothetical protein
MLEKILGLELVLLLEASEDGLVPFTAFPEESVDPGTLVKKLDKYIPYKDIICDALSFMCPFTKTLL